MHTQEVTCAVPAARPHDWDELALALLKAEAEANREGFQALTRTYSILTADNADGGWWGWNLMRKARTAHTRHGAWKERPEFTEIAVLVEGVAEKE